MPLQPPQSAWLDFLDWVEEPAQAIANPRSAGRHLANFAAGPIDALLPGDVIPSATRPEDYSDLSGVQKVLLNPITYTALIPGVGRGIRQGLARAGSAAYSALPTAGKNLADDARRTLGWDEYGKEFRIPQRTAQYNPPGYVAPTDPLTGKPLAAPPTVIPERVYDPHDLLNKASGIEHTSSQAQINDLVTRVQKVGGVTKDEDTALADVIDNLSWSGGKATVLDPNHQGTKLDKAGLITAAQQRLRTWMSQNPGTKVNPAKLDNLLAQHYDITERQLAEAKKRSAISSDRSQPDYLQRVYEGIEGAASAKKPREYQDATELAKFLADNPRVSLDRSWTGRMAGRALGQGKLLKRAYLREQLTDPVLAKHLLDPNDNSPMALEARRMMSEAMQSAVPDSDLWSRLRYELSGVPPQNAIENAMRSLNTVFKPAAVYGVGPFVRVGSIVRNQLTAYWQLAGTPEGRAYIMSDPAHGIRNLVGAFDDAISKNLLGQRLSGSDITQSMDSIEGALKAGGGTVDGTIALLRKSGRNIEADALESGLLNGFVMSEDLAKANLILRDRVNPATWFIPGHSAIADIGGKAFGGLEQRMRFAFFKDLVENQKKSAAEAAKMVNDRFIDYAQTSSGNRGLRTYFPFAQFIVKSVKQQGQMLAENPALLPAIGALYGGSQLPGYAQNQAHVGNVVGGFAPTDVFATIPNVTGSTSLEGFRESARPIVSAAHPLLGAAVGLASGVDSFSGRPYLADARLPGRDPRSTDRTAADTAFGLAEDVGILQPIAGPIQQARSLGNMKSPGLAALRYATGVNAVPELPPLQAERKQLEQSLQSDPRVQTFHRLYTKSQDPELLTALKRLAEIRKDLAAKASAVAAPLSPVPASGAFVAPPGSPL